MNLLKIFGLSEATIKSKVVGIITNNGMKQSPVNFIQFYIDSILTFIFKKRIYY